MATIVDVAFDDAAKKITISYEQAEVTALTPNDEGEFPSSQKVEDGSFSFSIEKPQDCLFKADSDTHAFNSDDSTVITLTRPLSDLVLDEHTRSGDIVIPPHAA